MIPTTKLNAGAQMPTLGFGTWKMDDHGLHAQASEAQTAVRSAIDAGYRLIDTAKLYGNERSVGSAVRESGVPREELFVTEQGLPLLSKTN